MFKHSQSLFGLIQTFYKRIFLAQQRLERTCQGDLAHVFYRDLSQRELAESNLVSLQRCLESLAGILWGVHLRSKLGMENHTSVIDYEKNRTWKTEQLILHSCLIECATSSPSRDFPAPHVILTVKPYFIDDFQTINHPVSTIINITPTVSPWNGYEISRFCFDEISRISLAFLSASSPLNSSSVKNPLVHCTYFPLLHVLPNNIPDMARTRYIILLAFEQDELMVCAFFVIVCVQMIS